MDGKAVLAQNCGILNMYLQEGKDKIAAAVREQVY